MIKTPSKCAEMGTYSCQVPVPTCGRVRGIDYCIADVVAALNAANIKTVASCCGHGEQTGNIMLEDGRIITIEMRDWLDGQRAASAEPENSVARQIKEEVSHE